MKASRLSTISILFAGSLLLCATAFAAKTSKKTMHLYEKAKLEGKVLNPGDYQVEWSGTGPNVELNIIQGRDTLATVPARVVAENTANENDGYVLEPAKNGGSLIEEIFFSGAKYELRIQPADKTSESLTRRDNRKRTRQRVRPDATLPAAWRLLERDFVRHSPNHDSFIAKGYERVNARGAVRRDPTREKGDRGEQAYDNREC